MTDFDKKKLKILGLKKVNISNDILTAYMTKLNHLLKNGLILKDKEKQKLIEINNTFKSIMNIANPQGLDISILPKNYLVNYLKGELILSILQGKKFSEMQEQYSQLKDLTSDFETDNLAALALVELYRGETQLSLSLIKKAIKINPYVEDYWIIMSNIYEKENNIQLAIYMLETAMNINLNNNKNIKKKYKELKKKLKEKKSSP